MKKVTMNLTETDVTNANQLYSTLKLRSKAQVVSMALSLAWFLANLLKKAPGSQLVVRNPDGSLEGIHVAEFDILQAR